MLEQNIQNDVNIVKIINTDRLNMNVVLNVKQQIVDYLNQNGAKLVLDLENIQYIDSSGFIIFISALKSSKNSGGSFVICNVNDGVMKLISLMKLDTILTIEKDVQTALSNI